MIRTLGRGAAATVGAIAAKTSKISHFIGVIVMAKNADAPPPRPICEVMPHSAVLVVEDDLKIATLVRFALEKDGLVVTHVADGSAALEEARQRRPDIMVLDLGLPGIDGFEVCRQLRAHPQTAVIPIVML